MRMADLTVTDVPLAHLEEDSDEAAENVLDAKNNNVSANCSPARSETSQALSDHSHACASTTASPEPGPGAGEGHHYHELMSSPRLAVPTTKGITGAGADGEDECSRCGSGSNSSSKGGGDLDGFCDEDILTDLEDLVTSFDEKITECFKDYKERTEKIAPVQVRTQEEIMNECQ